MATTTAPAVTRETLEDRWEGATSDRSDSGWTPAMWKLDEVIRDLFEAVARTEWTGKDASSDGSGDVTSAVHDAVRQTMLDEIDRRGLAR